MLNRFAADVRTAVAFAGAAATFLVANGFSAEGKWLSGVVATVAAFLVALSGSSSKKA